MTSIFIPSARSLAELKTITAALEAAGYDTDTARFGVAWDEFLKELPDHSTVVVYSVDFFSSLMELLSTLAQLHERGIALRSIQEPWLSEPVDTTTDLLIHLRELAFTLHATQTKQGLQKARTAGKQIGRPRKGR